MHRVGGREDLSGVVELALFCKVQLSCIETQVNRCTGTKHPIVPWLGRWGAEPCKAGLSAASGDLWDWVCLGSDSQELGS